MVGENLDTNKEYDVGRSPYCFMRNSLAILFLACFGGSAVAEMTRYELDPDHTIVYFEVEHLGFASVLGVFTEVDGSFMYDMESSELGEVDVVIKTASVDTFNPTRNDQVKSRDILDTFNFPDISFIANGGLQEGPNRGRVTGELKIRGWSQPITLSVGLNKAARYPFGHMREVLGLSITGELARSDFGINFGVSNGFIGDSVTIRIETEAVRIE